MSILADFILLGHEKIGTQALSVSKIELFMDTIEAWLGGIADVFNSYAIPRLLKLNGVDEENYPILKYSAPRDPDIGILGDYVSKLTPGRQPQRLLARTRWITVRRRRIS